MLGKQVTLRKRAFRKAASRVRWEVELRPSPCLLRGPSRGCGSLPSNELALLQGWTPHRPTSPGSAASRASVWPPFNQSGRQTGKSDVSSAANLSLRDSLGPHAAPAPSQSCGSHLC